MPPRHLNPPRPDAAPQSAPRIVVGVRPATGRPTVRPFRILQSSRAPAQLTLSLGRA